MRLAFHGWVVRLALTFALAPSVERETWRLAFRLLEGTRAARNRGAVAGEFAGKHLEPFPEVEQRTAVAVGAVVLKDTVSNLEVLEGMDRAAIIGQVAHQAAVAQNRIRSEDKHPAAIRVVHTLVPRSSISALATLLPAQVFLSFVCPAALNTALTLALVQPPFVMGRSTPLRITFAGLFLALAGKWCRHAIGLATRNGDAVDERVLHEHEDMESRPAIERGRTVNDGGLRAVRPLIRRGFAPRKAAQQAHPRAGYQRTSVMSGRGEVSAGGHPDLVPAPRHSHRVFELCKGRGPTRPILNARNVRSINIDHPRRTTFRASAVHAHGKPHDRGNQHHSTHHDCSPL